VVCGTNLGWKYLTAYEQSQKYKEGGSGLGNLAWGGVGSKGVGGRF
jgi:hypothetical protein